MTELSSYLNSSDIRSLIAEKKVSILRKPSDENHRYLIVGAVKGTLGYIEITKEKLNLLPKTMFLRKKRKKISFSHSEPNDELSIHHKDDSNYITKHQMLITVRVYLKKKLPIVFLNSVRTFILTYI